MALYHELRPARFSDVLGQDHVTKTLQSQLANSSTGHAYIFAGPRGIGKTTTARILARSINCENPDNGVACDACNSCTSILDQKVIDIVEIDAASNTGVDNVRSNIIDNAIFKPTQLKKKVFIIDEVHMLSISAFNALLKIMEEPPAHILFILATTELHKIPETIISRCQRFDFKRIPVSIITDYLASIAKDKSLTIEPEVLTAIAARSEGCARDAVSLFEQVISSGETTITLSSIQEILPHASHALPMQFLQGICTKDASLGIKAITDANDANVHAADFLTHIMVLSRDLLLLSLRQEPESFQSTYSADDLGKLRSLTSSISPAQLVVFIDQCQKRLPQTKQSPIPMLPLQLLVAEFASGDTGMQPIVDVQKVAAPVPPPPKQEAPSTPPPPAKPEPEQPEEEPATPPVPTNTTPVNPGNWQDVLAKIQAEKPSLILILKTANTTQSESSISIEVPFSFHRDKLTATETKKYLDETVQSIFQNPTITVDVFVKEAEKLDDDLADIASALGGSVIS